MAVNHLRFLRGLWHHIGQVNQGRHPIYLDYAVQPKRRYGWGHPPHPELTELISGQRAKYEQVLASLEEFVPMLREIPFVTASKHEPHWANGHMTGLDAATLYAFPKLYASARYLEVGSGNSTRFMRRSIRDNNLSTKVISIDPSPRSQVDDLCDEVIRLGLEEAPPELFDALGRNDILLLDGSHRCFQNSDVTVVFLEVLPRLRPGVLVFIHDIFLPDDYPEIWAKRFYSEQYLLGALLLADQGQRYEIVFPAHFSATDGTLGPRTRETWRRISPADLEVRASGFWLRVKGPE
jgi:hypothetical protein